MWLQVYEWVVRGNDNNCTDQMSDSHWFADWCNFLGCGLWIWMCGMRLGDRLDNFMLQEWENCVPIDPVWIPVNLLPYH